MTMGYPDLETEEDERLARRLGSAIAADLPFPPRRTPRLAVG
jgi:hypothetical protein